MVTAASFAGGTLRFFLPAHVRACYTGGHVVLLDLRRDKYLAVSGPSAETLAMYVEGWPTGGSRDCNGESGAPVPPLINQMLVRGLLTSRSAERAGPIAVLPRPESTLLTNDANYRPRIGAARVARFLLAVTGAAVRLRWRGLDHIVNAVRARKAKGTAAGAQFQLRAAQEAVMAFDHLRPLAFSSRGACLLDSLAVIDYLAGEHLYPTWVIGVKTKPFGAHSWVQQDQDVLNDLPEHVRAFTPILTV